LSFHTVILSVARCAARRIPRRLDRRPVRDNERESPAIGRALRFHPDEKPRPGIAA
jgi:hypothetical protein